MMTMTMIERAARAAQEADGAYRHESGQWMKEGGLVSDSHWQDIVRAVLDAIREPSEGMAKAGDDASPEHIGTLATQRPIGAARVKQVWRSMIDAAMREK